jgi:phasin family protein
MARFEKTTKRPVGRPRKILTEAANSGPAVPKRTRGAGSNRAMSMQAHRPAEILRESVEEVTGTGSRRAKPDLDLNRAAPEQADRAVEVLGDTVGQASATAQQASNAARNGMRSGMEAASNATRSFTDQFAGAFTFKGSQGGEFAESASRSLGAFTQVGSVLTQGAQDLAREWMELTQAGVSKNVENVTALAACRSFPELFAAQTKLVQENVQQVMEGSRRLAERSMQLAGQATQSITAQGIKPQM